MNVALPQDALERIRRKMRKSNFALRLQPSLLEEARKMAEEEGVALNQPINAAVAEKLSEAGHQRSAKRAASKTRPGSRRS